MKRFLSILLAVVLVSALFVAAAVTAGAKKSKNQQYLQLIHPAERAGEDQFVCWVIPWDDIFEQNKQYTFFANVMFGDDINPNNGCAYVNVYSYGSLDAAMTSDFDYLFAFMDFAIVNASTHPEPNTWAEYSYTFDPSVNLRGSSGDKCEAVWISAGFWMATGTISILDLGVKDPETGEIIYYRDFADGIDYDEPNFRYTADMEEENRGIYWDLLDYKSDGKKEESSEDEPVDESSEDEPVVESSEDEPVVESSEDEPVVESSEDEPVVESSEEPEPVASEEPSKANEEPSAAPSEAEQASEPASEAPAESNGPGPVLWIILGAVAVAIAIAIILILVLKKKKAA